MKRTQSTAARRLNTAILVLGFGLTLLSFGCRAGSETTSGATTSTNNAPGTPAPNGLVPSALGWYQIPNTSLAPLCPPYGDIQGNTGCDSNVSAYGTAAIDTRRNRMIIHSGGHTDYYGNEIYALDFSGSSFTTLLVRDSSHGSGVDSVVAACGETFPDGTPNSRHDESGWLYLPTTDEYFQYGFGLAACGNFSDGQWAYSPSANTWTRLDTTQSTHPNTATDGSAPIPAYDSVTDSLFMYTENSSEFWQYNRSSNNWTKLFHSFQAGCTGTESHAIVDPVRRLYVCSGNGELKTISLNSPYTATDDSAVGSCSAWVGTDINGPGMVYDPVQQLIVVWIGGNHVFTYNPSTHSCATLTPAGSGPPAPMAPDINALGQQLWGTFNRFAYIPNLGGFLLLNDMGQNFWFLRLTSASQDFQTRCAQTGVIVCQGFDNASVFTPATWPGSGLYPSDVNTYGTMDTSVYTSGGGSLKFTIPSLEGSNAGYWRQLFASSLSAAPSQAQVMGSGSTFYVQFRQRFSPEFLTNQWPLTGGGTTYWKQEIFSSDQSTCGNEELTTVNDFNRGYPMMYSQCGQDIFQVPVGSGDYLNEQGDTPTTGYNCHYQTSTTCFLYPANTWVTFYYKVAIGLWGQANSTVQAWVAVGGQPYKEWINMPNHTLNQDAGLPGYDMATLLPYMTGRDNNVSAGPTAYTWYDELIVSRQPIAAPTGP